MRRSYVRHGLLAYAARDGDDATHMLPERGGYAARWRCPPGAAASRGPRRRMARGGGSPYLPARLIVVVESVEVRLNRVGLQVGLTALAHSSQRCSGRGRRGSLDEQTGAGGD